MISTNSGGASAVSFLGQYQRRAVDDDLDVLFADLAAILLDGPKGVGKTATAMQRCNTVRRLDQSPQVELMAADPSILADDPPPVLIDEWQRVPEVWDTVRRIVDDEPEGGRFLLTGSAPRAGTHSGAGRIADLRVRPLCLGERLAIEPTVSFRALLDGTHGRVAGSCSLALGDYTDEIIAGGFPGMRHLAGQSLATQIDGYVRRIVDHDVPEAGLVVRRPAALLAWLRAYAAATATTTSWEKIRDAATAGVADKPARSTTNSYTELLTALRILDPVEAWVPTFNHLDRLGSAAKHHLADPALAVRLLRRTRRHLLSPDQGDVNNAVVPLDGSLLGNLFESLAALSIRTYAQSAAADVHHMRTAGGRREVDFIVEADGRVLAVEVKLGQRIDDHDVRHLVWLRDQLGDDLVDAIVVTTGPDAYRRRDGIAVVPLGLLGP